MKKLCLLSSLFTFMLVASGADTPAAAAKTKLWSVKFLCGVVPEFPLSFWFSDLNIHNPHLADTTLMLKVTTEGGVLNQGTVTLPGNGVLDLGCFDFLGPGPWGVKGFVEVISRRKLQVIGIVKNYAFSEDKKEKGFVIPRIQVGEREWVYASEYICGEIESEMPASFQDVFALIADEDLARVWRPGVEGTDFFVLNAGPTSASYSLQVIDTDNAVLLERSRQTLPPNGVLRVDCDSFERSESQSAGFFIVRVDSPFIQAMTDIKKYQSLISVTVDLNEYRPLLTRKSK